MIHDNENYTAISKIGLENLINEWMNEFIILTQELQMFDDNS